MRLLKSFSKIKVCARSSPLSKAQVKEVLAEIKKSYPDTVFDIQYEQTTGDVDQKTSLWNLEKTDFFTKQLDELVLEKKASIAIHSAKDLPEPLPEGLHIAAITKGVDSRDSLVLRSDDTLEKLPSNSIIATSSERRKQAVCELRSDLSFMDIRGDILKRLQVLDAKRCDGVVIAEAALIRLKLIHLNRVFLPGETPPMQGKLAIVCHEKNLMMKRLFAKIDFRCQKLYT